MYVSIGGFVVGPGKRDFVEGLMEKQGPGLKERKGFKEATFYGDDEIGEYGSVILWETKADAEAARAENFPMLEEAIKDIARGKPEMRIYEVVGK